MGIVWDREKEERLRRERGSELREVAELIEERRYRDILENPSRPGQYIFVLPYRGYTHIVPFVLDGDDIVFKTVFPSRRFHRQYGAQP